MVRNYKILLATFLFISIAGAKLDKSTFNKPLYDQVVERMESKIREKLATGPQRTRYFLVPFGYADRDNNSENSHTFVSLVKTGPGFSHLKPTTISWLPHDFDINPNLVVFKGPGAHVDPLKNLAPTPAGHSFTLEQTLKMAYDAKLLVGMWGPYEVKETFYEKGIDRWEYLAANRVKYRADDRESAKIPDGKNDPEAINCYHACMQIGSHFPRGGFLNTGLDQWGINGTRHVLEEYYAKVNGIPYTDPVTKKTTTLDWFIDHLPAKINDNLYGFVYAKKPNQWWNPNPFKNASVYH